jgi:hypothetical protein
MLSFKCSHCTKEIEFTIQEAKNIQSKVKEVANHSVCPGCMVEYQQIEKKVKDFANQKRKELEAEFFHENLVEKHVEEIEESLEKELEGEV